MASDDLLFDANGKVKTCEVCRENPGTAVITDGDDETLYCVVCPACIDKPSGWERVLEKKGEGKC